MNADKNIDEFLTINSLKTLGGSSTAVWLTSGVIGFIFAKCDPYPDWLKLTALILSVIISIGITVSRKKKMVKFYIIALLNAILIFSTATGYNTIHNQFSKSQGCDDTVKTKTLNSQQNEVYRSSILSFLDKPWFLPKTLVEENETLHKEKERLLKERDSVVSVNKRLSEETALPPKNERDFKNKLDSLNNLFNRTLNENNNLKKEIEQLKNSLKKAVAENEDCKNRLAKLQADYKALQAKFDKLSKDCAGYDKLKSSCEQLKSEYEKLKRSYDGLKSKYETIQSQLQECNKNLRDCQSKLNPIR